MKVGDTPDRMLRTRDDVHMNDIRHIEPNEDPVCGMQVDPDAARARGLALTHDGREFVFCGKGCLLEFRDDPDAYLDPAHPPTM
jgi:YHS domain-containing protein